MPKRLHINLRILILNMVLVEGVWYMVYEHKDPTNTMVSGLPSYLALEPECRILIFM